MLKLVAMLVIYGSKTYSIKLIHYVTDVAIDLSVELNT